MALLEPDAFWRWIAQRRGQPLAVPLLLAFALLGGLVVAGATEIGVRVFNTDWNYVGGYAAQPNRTWTSFAMLWTMATARPVAQGLFGGSLLPLYGRPRDPVGGLAVGVAGAAPVYAVSPALVLLPGVLVVCVAFLVSCTWWGSGARLLLGVPIGESSDHVVASIIAGSVTLTIVSGLLAMV